MERQAASRSKVLVGVALIFSMLGWAVAQPRDHGSMPGMRMEEKKESPASGAPRGGMEMPDPMERPIPGDGVPRATETKGGQPLLFKIVDGVKVFELTAKPVKWLILPKFKSLPDVWATA